MSIEHIELLVEEPSMEAALRALLPKVVATLSFEIYPYQCKDELLMRLPERLKGYASWMPKNWRIVVVLDRDDEDCLALKKRLEQLAKNAGLVTRSATKNKHYDIVNRLAIEELEAWYFGDWQAVKSAYPRVSATIPRKNKYRDPDAIAGGTWEAFERVLKKAGYFKNGLQKIKVARAVSEHMDPKRNCSHSFQIFRDALSEMLSA